MAPVSGYSEDQFPLSKREGKLDLHAGAQVKLRQTVQFASWRQPGVRFLAHDCPLYVLPEGLQDSLRTCPCVSQNQGLDSMSRVFLYRKAIVWTPRLTGLYIPEGQKRSNQHDTRSVFLAFGDQARAWGEFLQSCWVFGEFCKSIAKHVLRSKTNAVRL